MDNQVSWMVEVAIPAGKLEEFCAVARDLIAATQSEPGTLDYEWSLSADKTTCHIFERYTDSQAVITHVASFHTFASRFLAACQPLKLTVYGAPSAEAKAQLDDMSPDYFSALGGFSR